MKNNFTYNELMTLLESTSVYNSKLLNEQTRYINKGDLITGDYYDRKIENLLIVQKKIMKLVA